MKICEVNLSPDDPLKFLINSGNILNRLKEQKQWFYELKRWMKKSNGLKHYNKQKTKSKKKRNQMKKKYKIYKKWMNTQK